MSRSTRYTTKLYRGFGLYRGLYRVICVINQATQTVLTGFSTFPTRLSNFPHNLLLAHPPPFPSVHPSLLSVSSVRTNKRHHHHLCSFFKQICCGLYSKDGNPPSLTVAGAMRLIRGRLDVVEHDGVQVQGAAMVGWKKTCNADPPVSD